MADSGFFIAFAGSQGRYAALSRAFDRLRAAKGQFADDSDVDAVAAAIAHEFAAVGGVDGSLITPVAPGEWSLEDVVWCVLNGEYQLVSLTFDGTSGRLVYDPAAFPFGGTDPIKALITLFGFEVTRDSFWDGFLESRHGNV